MPVVLRFQSTGAVPNDGAPIVMRGPSLTIGRGQENDVVLPDPDRLLSKRHCAIEDHDGNVIVIDFSTNGTFLNYGKIPLGRVPTPLNDGDVLSMGAYEIVVAISSSRTADPLRDLPPPVDDGPVSHGNADVAPDLMDLLDGPSARKSDFLDDLMGAEPPRGPSTVVREDPIDELAAPLIPGEEDPILGRIPDPLDDFTGASQRQHGAAVHDSFHVAKKSTLIPDDWDDDLLSPAPKPGGRGADPFGGGRPPPPPAAPGPRAVPDLPPEAFEGLLPGASVVPRPPPARPREPAPAADDASSPFAAPVAGKHASVVPPPPKAVSVPASAPAPAAAPARPAPPVAPSAPPRPALAGDPARAFFQGAGAEDVVIPDAELAATMHRLGEVVRILIEGLRDVLMTRASIKTEFRMERTQISAKGNNPLKFALSGEHAVEMILRPKAKGYMDSGAAVKEAIEDIKAHEVAMVTGMQAAIRDVLSKLDPKAVEARAGSGGGLAVLGGRKARLWDEYEKLFAQVSEQAENDFHEFFSREFARAYQEQLGKLK